MRILYISQYFPPEIGAPAARVSELSRAWAAAGHQVTVLTGFPNHPSGKLHPEYREKLRRLWMREDWNGVRVERTWLWPLPNRKSWERIINYTSFAVSAALRGLFLPRPDVVIATSPQLLVGASGLFVAGLRRLPLVFEVRDLWPESLVAVGASGERSLVYRILARVARTLYRRSDRIVLASPAFQPHLVERWGVPPQKLAVIVNGVDTALFSPQADPSWARDTFQLQGRFVVAMVGTMGNAHGLTTALDSAEQIAGLRSDVLFLLVGDGAEREPLERAVAARRLQNVCIAPAQPRERVPGIVAAADVCVSLLRRSELFKSVIPTKMLEYMAAARPVIVGVEGQARAIVEAASAGIAIAPEDQAALTAAILRLAEEPHTAAAMGQSGRQYILQHFRREETARQYLALLEEVAHPQTAVRG